LPRCSFELADESARVGWPNTAVVRKVGGVPIELVIETHSTSVDNEQGRATGWLPGELSEQGRAQARDLVPVPEPMGR
jgi:hypothetical protein